MLLLFLELSLFFTFFDMNTYLPIVILPTVPSDLHTEIAADVLDCSNRLGVGWPVCVCVCVSGKLSADVPRH